MCWTSFDRPFRSMKLEDGYPGVPRVCQDAQQRAVKRWMRRHIWDS
jgi:hypothetical protein